MYSSDKDQGFRILWMNLISLLVLVVGTNISREYRTEEIIGSFVICGIPAAILNITFGLFPAIETRFYESSISKYFVTPSSISTRLTNNVVDPNKAGIWFVNTNNASVYFLLFVAMSIIMYRRTNKRKYSIACVLFLGAQLATGCRTGIIALLGYVLYLLYIDNILSVSKKNAIKILRSFILIFLILIIIINSNVGFIQNILNRISIENLRSDSRIIIWETALKNMNILGCGYGYWEKIALQELPVGLQGMPQHNHLLILIYWGGFFAVALYLIFWIGNLKGGLKKTVNSRFDESNILSLIAIDVICHGMFDNYFLGHMNLVLIVFLLIGFCIGKKSEKLIKGVKQYAE